MSHTPSSLNAVILPIIRRVMPQVLAHQIVGVQPMTNPTGSVFTMRARYGAYQYGTCTTKECSRPEFPYIVTIGLEQDAPMDEIGIWAIQNLHHPHMSRYVGEGDLDMIRGWRWSFLDEHDAFQFKMRWVGLPTP